MFDHRDTAVQHKVRTGDSLRSLAEEHQLEWQHLAEYNWGTRIPEQINDHLAEDVGCTQRDPAGNYIFDDSDDPGIILIPENFARGGLKAGMVHTIRTKGPDHTDRVLDCVALPGATFKFGRSFIRPNVVPMIERILDRVDEFIDEYRDVRLCVFGHTDGTPIKKSGWKDNWELSTQRSLEVVRYMADRGVARVRLVAGGCGENRPRVQNSSEANRGKNRRVEIFAIDSALLAGG
ncbi:MAG: OmpA family protein [Planctomycetes bacterium]|nr:OmpA family protein [Planctomycetota bacterium]